MAGIGELAIMAAISIGSSVISSALAPKQHLLPVDKGRFDDIRIQGSEYGTMIPIVYGRARLAGNIIWSDGVQPYVTTTPGRSGKGGLFGGGKQPEPPTNYYTYKTNMAVAICRGEIKGGLKKVWENIKVTVDYDVFPQVNYGTLYEAEFAVLTNGSIIARDPAASGGSKVLLPNTNSSIKFTGIVATVTDTHGVKIYYSSITDFSCMVKVNTSAAESLFFPSTGNYNTFQEITYNANFVTGSANTFEIFRNSSALAPQFDAIRVISPVEVIPPQTVPPFITGFVDIDGTYPSNESDVYKYYNRRPIMNGNGTVAGTIQSGQNAGLRFYNGSELQLPDPTMEAIDGAGSNSAYRGTAYVMFEGYTISEGQLPNFSFEIEEGTHDLADIIISLWAMVGLDQTKLDVTQLRGIYVEGLVINSRGQLSDILNALMVAYAFDLVDANSKIIAVVRGNASVVTIPETELRAYESGTDAPISSIDTSYTDEIQLPRQIDISYSDKNLHYHQNVQSALKQIGFTEDPITMTLPLVLSASDAQKIGLRVLHTIHLQRKEFTFSLGPKYSWLTPTDVITIPLANVTHQLRVTGLQAGLPGLVRVKAVPESASVYDQVLTGFEGDGTEIRPVPYPPNSKFVLMDIPPVYTEQTGIGFYAAACGIGVGLWTGSILYQEEIVSNNYVRIAGFDVPATIGVISGAGTGALLPSYTVDANGFDISSDLYINLYYGTLESFTEAQVMSSAANLAYIGGEMVQFATAVLQTATPPYAYRYRVTKFLRGVNGTGARIAGHTSNENFVLFNNAVKFIREESRALYIAANYKAVTLGQSVDNAPIINFTMVGHSAPPVATNLVLTVGEELSVENNYLLSIIGSFNFGTYVGGQRAKIFLKKPTDTVFVNTGIVVFPDDNNQGHFVITGVSTGIFSVRIVVESPVGQVNPDAPVENTITIGPSLSTILKIFDNVVPKDLLTGFGLTFGIARNASETGNWYGATLWRDRGYGYEKIGDLKKEASLGHTTNNSINWLGNGGGGSYAILWVIKEGGAVFTNATTGEIASGKNNYFVGREKIGVHTWTNMGSGLWKGENLIRGLNHTEIFQATHIAQEDVLQLDENSVFIPIEQRDIGVTLSFKAVTYGQLIGGASPVTFVVRGDSVRPYAVSDTLIIKNPSLDWLVQFDGNPRMEEIPEDYAVEVWPSTTRIDPATIKRTLPIVLGTTHAVVPIATVYGTYGALKNNIYCSAGPAVTGVSAEALTETYTRFDFNLRWIGTDNGLMIPISILQFTNEAFGGPAGTSGALRRAPTSGELSAWTTALTTAFNTSPAALLAEAQSRIHNLFISTEYTVTFPRTAAQFIEDVYGAYLGRLSDLDGYTFWLGVLLGGVGDTAAHRLDILAAFEASAEFNRRVTTIEPPDSPRRKALVALQTRADAVAVGGVFTPNLAVSPLSIEWQSGGRVGTVHEIIKSFGVVVFRGVTTEAFTRHDIDPGFSPSRLNPELGGRVGQRYTFLLSGTEYRVYANYIAGQGHKPLVIVPTPSTGYPFPLRLAVEIKDETGGELAVENITAGGNLRPTTIYAEREQLADFGSTQTVINLRIYQRSQITGINGFPLDIQGV